MKDFSRRGLMAAGAATVVFPFLTGPSRAFPLTAQNVISWRDKTLAQHQALWVPAFNAGFRTVSLSIYGDPSDPRYVAVMAKPPVAFAAKQFDKLTATAYDAKVTAMQGAGYAPYLVSATGSGDYAMFAAVFAKVGALAVRGMSGSDLNKANAVAQIKGLIPIWIDAYGTAGDTRYVGSWIVNATSDAWNCDAIDDPNDLLQAKFDRLTETWARTGHVTPTPSGGHLMVFNDSTLGAWSAWGDMTLAEYDAQTAGAAAGGLQPLRVSAWGVGAGARFAAIYAGRNDPDPRTVTASSLAPNAAIDAVMAKYIQAVDVRGCALAITNGSRLIYAAGYSNAEPSYPTVGPTTSFRLASVSKMFLAAAIWKLIDQGQVALSTTLHDALGLTEATGMPAADGVDNITVQQLLESVSGMNQSMIFDSILAAQEAAMAAGAPLVLPCTPWQLAQHAAAASLYATPGAIPSSYEYGNLNYFLLSQIVAKFAGATPGDPHGTFEAGLKALVLDPLDIGDTTHSSVSLIGEQPTSEARHHMRVYAPTGDPLPLIPLGVGQSLHSTDQPLVAEQYGAYDYEIYDGCGGLSASAVDVARLIANFSVSTGNPVYADATLANWLSTAAAATLTVNENDVKTNGRNGFHGFDSCTLMPNGAYDAGKGGWFVSHECSVWFETGSIGIVVLHNGNVKPNNGFDLNSALAGVASSVDLTVDYFPMYFDKALHKKKFIPGKPPHPLPPHAHAVFRPSPAAALARVRKEMSRQIAEAKKRARPKPPPIRHPGVRVRLGGHVRPPIRTPRR